MTCSDDGSLAIYTMELANWKTNHPLAGWKKCGKGYSILPRWKEND